MLVLSCLMSERSITCFSTKGAVKSVKCSVSSNYWRNNGEQNTPIFLHSGKYDRRKYGQYDSKQGNKYPHIQEQAKVKHDGTSDDEKQDFSGREIAFAVERQH